MSARIEDGLTLSDLPIICWQNLVTINNVAAEAEADFPVTNVANPSLALKWKHETSDSPISATEYLRVDLSSDRINYVAIAGHNFSSAGITVGLELASYNSPVGQADIVFDAQTPPDDGPLIFLFSAREVEEVRIFFNPGSAQAEAAVVYAGEYLQLEDGIQGDHTPLPLARVFDVVNGRSENGTFLGRIVTGQGLTSTATISNMDPTFVRDELVPFFEFAATDPFFWIWQPNSFPLEVAFAWLDSDPQPSFDIDGYVSVDLSMRGVSQ